MTKESLMLFMKRILENGSEEKSAASLHQLTEILKTQNADAEMIDLVTRTLNALPDAKAAAQSQLFSAESLRIAIRRAQERREWAAQMEERGRC